MDFYEMTCKDIGDFCLAQQNKEKEQYKWLAVVGFRCADKIIAGVNLKNPKNIRFEELFPEFKEKQPTNLTEEQKNIVIAEKWREFLKG